MTTKRVEIWRSEGFDETIQYVVPIEEIETYIYPLINPSTYLEIRKEYLAETYSIDADELTIEDIDWEQEQSYLRYVEESRFELKDFTKEFAESRGFLPLPDIEEKASAYTYFIGSELKYLWKSEGISLENCEISTDAVCLDEWDGSNFFTSQKFYHQYVYKVITGDKPTYLITATTDWQGFIPLPIVKLIDATLDEVLEYIENLDDTFERDLDEYKKRILDLK